MKSWLGFALSGAYLLWTLTLFLGAHFDTESYAYAPVSAYTMPWSGILATLFSKNPSYNPSLAYLIIILSMLLNAILLYIVGWAISKLIYRIKETREAKYL